MAKEELLKMVDELRYAELFEALDKKGLNTEKFCKTDFSLFRYTD